MVSYPRRKSVKAHSLTTDPYKLFLSLKSGLDYRPVALPPPPKPRAPYKFLDYFEAEDRAIFIGRDAEINELTSRVMSHRMTVLYAYSGMGKTSLLQAGVIPRLQCEGFGVESIRLGTDPLAELQAVMQQMATSSSYDVASVDSPKPSSSLGQVLIVDQAEELFTVHTLEERKEYVKMLLAFLDQGEHNLHVLLSLSIEYLGQLEDVFSQQERSDVLSNRFRLGALGLEQTRQAIIKPAALFQIEVEPALADALLTYLETSGFDPSQLQILCYQLCKDLESLNKVDSKVMTLARYKELGEAEGILADLMEDVLARLGEEEAQESAKVLLRNMVTIERTKDTLRLEEIAGRVMYASLSETQVREMLVLLQSQRVVRRLEDGRFELAHDVLVSKIWTWMDETDLARLDAARILRQAMSHYRHYHHLMSREKQIAIEQAAGLMTLNPDELALLLMSAIDTNDRKRVLVWIKRVDDYADESAQDNATSEILRLVDLSEVCDNLTRFFDEEELNDLCFDLGVDYGNLPGRVRDKAEELVAYIDRHGLIAELARACYQVRPDLSLGIPEEIRETLFAIRSDIPDGFAKVLSVLEDAQQLSQVRDSALRAEILIRRDLLPILRKVLRKYYDLSEIKDVCFRLDVDFEQLAAEGRSGKARELVKSCVDKGELDILFATARIVNHHWTATGEWAKFDIAPPSPGGNIILLNLLDREFSLEELGDLCRYLEFKLEDVASPGSGKRDCVRKLILLASRKTRLDHLKLAIVRFRHDLTDHMDLELTKTLATRFDMEQIRTLCFDLGVNYSRIDSPDKREAVRHLVQFMVEKHRVSDLIDAIIFPDRVGSDYFEGVLRRRLVEGMNYDDLNKLCWFHLGVDPELIAGENVNSKSRELVLYMKRRGRLGELVFWTMQAYPETLPADEVWEKVRSTLKERGQAQTLLNEVFRESYTELSTNQKENLQTYLHMLCLILEQCYDMTEFRTLCFDLGLRYDNLKGKTLFEKEHEFVNVLQQSDRLRDLKSYFLRTRPHVAYLIKEPQSDGES